MLKISMCCSSPLFRTVARVHLAGLRGSRLYFLAAAKISTKGQQLVGPGGAGLSRGAYRSRLRKLDECAHCAEVGVVGEEDSG